MNANLKCFLLGHDWVWSIYKIGDEKLDVKVCIRCRRVETYSLHCFSYLTIEQHLKLTNRKKDRMAMADKIIESKNIKQLKQ